MAEAGGDASSNMLFKTSNYSFDNWDGNKSIAKISSPLIYLYGDNSGGSALIETVIRDTGIAHRYIAGHTISGVVSGSDDVSQYHYYGEDIRVLTDAGFQFNSVTAGANNFGRNYVFSIQDANAGRTMWVGKGWGGSFTQAFEVQANQNTIFGPVNTSDEGSKVQSYGTGNNSLYTATINATNNAVSYPLTLEHVLSSGNSAIGFGVGYKFKGNNSAVALRDMASIEAVYTNVTNTTEEADIIFRTIRAGTANTVVATFAGSGNVTFGTTNSIVGTATNNNAVAGNIGEETNSTVSTYTNYTTTATYQNIASITLTAGDWDVTAQGTFSSNGATITGASDAIFVISTTTASASGATEGKNIAYVPQAALLGTSHESISMAPFRVSLSGSTTYYLNTQATFTVGNPQFVGSIRARRVR
jgi:hypothetical protein